MSGTSRAIGRFGVGRRLLQVIDCHAEGEPARVIVGGMPHIPGSDMNEKRANFMRDFDHYRKLLILEPRGYPCQNADFIVPSTRADAAFGVIVAEQGKIYPAMSGHNIMCVSTALLESGMVPMDEPTSEFALDLPAGLVSVRADCAHGKATRITLRNAPAFCRPADMDVAINVPTVGEVKVDIAYGGMHYVIVDAASVGLTLEPSRGKEICRLGEMIKIAAREQHPVSRALNPPFRLHASVSLRTHTRCTVAPRPASTPTRRALKAHSPRRHLVRARARRPDHRLPRPRHSRLP